MIVVDTSAVLAILYAEHDALRYAAALARAVEPLISAASYVEAGVVIDTQLGPAAGRQLDALLDRGGFKVEPVTVEHARLARQAYADFGKGRHPAALNLGDCFSYALARSMQLPLLFKGEDFAQTDIGSAI